MADRLPSDHEAVETHRVTVASVGRTDRPRVELPDDLDVNEGDVVRLVLDGEEYHARVDAALDGSLVVSHVADNARLAREGDGENRLAEWVDGSEVALGGSAHLDVVTTGYKYGLREPGTRVVYSATDAPDSSLADIASDLDG
ncbi:DUF7112 family protein [Halomicrobium salinisoli]|uniref:DUF7112 family protein n=1 Tax=Halomicrobium salinisoli TaxID=2878391 RepID=UPI001CEFD49A|nr:hypothetical protein [Halomicrobium salinisoli]